MIRPFVWFISAEPRPSRRRSLNLRRQKAVNFNMSYPFVSIRIRTHGRTYKRVFMGILVWSNAANMRGLRAQLLVVHLLILRCELLKSLRLTCTLLLGQT